MGWWLSSSMKVLSTTKLHTVIQCVLTFWSMMGCACDGGLTSYNARCYSGICDDAGVNKPPPLPVVWKYSTHHYAQYVLLDDDNKPPCYWFMCLLHYTFIVILECTLSAYKKMFIVKQYAVLHRQQPHTSRVYRVSWLPCFLLCLGCLVP